MPIASHVLHAVPIMNSSLLASVSSVYTVYKAFPSRVYNAIVGMVYILYLQKRPEGNSRGLQQ